MDTVCFRRVRTTESCPAFRLLVAGVLALLSVSACSAGRSTVATPQSRGEAPITGARLRAHMSVLSADDMEGRETGTLGFDRAAGYVADQLRSYGLRPVGQHWFQPLTIRRAHVVETGTSLVVRLPAQDWRLRYGEDYVTYGVRREGEQLDAAGDLVFAGDGVSVLDRGLDAYQRLDVRNKIVVLVPGAPPTLSASERSFFADATQKATTAAANGALAVLLFDDPEIPWALRVNAARQLGTSETRPLDTSAIAPIPVLYLHQRFAEPLVETGSVRARRPLGPIAGSGAILQLRQQAREVRSANVVAVLPGHDARVSRELVVVVAHGDHVGIGAPSGGDAVYNGAVDNASGVAALLEIARTFAADPPARSVLFLCTTGEEQGLVGARAFVAQRNRLPGPVVAAINIDGTAIQPFRSLDVRGGSQSSLGALAEEAARRVGIGVQHEALGVGGSDHAPFLLAGIPPIWIGAALPDDWMRTRYHTPHDDMTQPIDFDAAAEYTQFVSTVARLAADAPTRPAWRDGEFFGRPR